jgi:hypothetical protein
MPISEKPESNPQDCSQSEQPNNHAGSRKTQPADKKPVSERKRQANRENSKKSTGPRTASGKRYSSFNAMTHGMLAKQVMYAPDGKLIDENLKRMFDTLREEYSRGDAATELLAELAAVDYWRLHKGLEYERKYLGPKGGDFHPQGAMPVLSRYMVTTRHSFEKSLTALMQLRAQSLATAEGENNTSLGGSIQPVPDDQNRPSGKDGKKKSHAEATEDAEEVA